MFIAKNKRISNRSERLGVKAIRGRFESYG